MAWSRRSRPRAGCPMSRRRCETWENGNHPVARAPSPANCRTATGHVETAAPAVRRSEAPQIVWGGHSCPPMMLCTSRVRIRVRLQPHRLPPAALGDAPLRRDYHRKDRRKMNRQPTFESMSEIACFRQFGKNVSRGLRSKLPVRTVEKGTVSEYLCVPKAEAQEQESNIKRGPTAPTMTSFGVPPNRQLWTHG
jgi:hypothetical protein